jgi:hypothetical protein
MDEVRMVREAYAEPAPPTAREIARARALLNDPPRRPVRWQWWGFGGVVAAGAAAAVAISLTGGGSPGRPGPVTRTSLDAKGAVLAAAHQAERQPLGKYWYSNSFDGQAYIMRAKTGTYAITAATAESFSWFGVKPGMGEAYFARDLPAHPQTARDAELWRKAGSPTSFHVWSNDHYYTYPGKVSPKWRSSGPEVGSNPRGGGKFLVDMTTEELQNLPTDPAALAAKFLNINDADKQNPMGKAMGLRGGKVPPAALARMRIARVGSLLNGAPMPPKVRAGLMRALADQPGIHAIGRDTDALGRTGVALASDDRATTITGEWGGPKAEQGTYRSRSVIIFDERTGGLLAEQEELTKPGGPYSEMKPGFIINYVAARSSNWTDTKPSPPAELPFR